MSSAVITTSFAVMRSQGRRICGRELIVTVPLDTHQRAVTNRDGAAAVIADYAPGRQAVAVRDNNYSRAARLSGERHCHADDTRFGGHRLPFSRG
jgi:hypothetical protein